MSLNVGDRVRALVRCGNREEEITTTVLKINVSFALVEWKSGVIHNIDGKRVRAWWVYKDMSVPRVGSCGQILCKNWRKYEEK